jgi:glutaredoxin
MAPCTCRALDPESTRRQAIEPARRRDASLPRLAAVVFVVLVSAATSGGDWLVTRSGQRIETKGGWTVKDDRVVFRTPAGTLMTLPLAAIDPEATRGALSPPPTPSPSARARATVRLTDEDVTHVDPSQIAAAPAPDTTTVARSEPTRSHRVTMYSTAWCSVCRTAKAYFDRHHVAFTEKDVDKDQAAKADLAARLPGFRGVPVIDIDGTLLKGFSSDQVGQILGIPPEPPAKPGTRSPHHT